MATVAAHRRQRRHPNAVAGQRLAPDDRAGERIQTVGVAVRRDDEPIAIDEQGDVARFELIVGPDDFAGVAVQRDDVAAEADEDEMIGAGHDETSLAVAWSGVWDKNPGRCLTSRPGTGLIIPRLRSCQPYRLMTVTPGPGARPRGMRDP